MSIYHFQIGGFDMCIKGLLELDMINKMNICDLIIICLVNIPNRVISTKETNDGTF